MSSRQHVIVVPAQGTEHASYNRGGAVCTAIFHLLCGAACMVAQWVTRTKVEEYSLVYSLIPSFTDEKFDYPQLTAGFGVGALFLVTGFFGLLSAWNDCCLLCLYLFLSISSMIAALGGAIFYGFSSHSVGLDVQTIQAYCDLLFGVCNIEPLKTVVLDINIIYAMFIVIAAACCVELIVAVSSSIFSGNGLSSGRANAPVPVAYYNTSPAQNPVMCDPRPICNSKPFVPNSVPVSDPKVHDSESDSDSDSDSDSGSGSDSESVTR